MNQSKREIELEARIQQLESEIRELRRNSFESVTGPTVRVPDAIQPLFEVAQTTVRQFFSQFRTDPTKALIEINDERYVLLRTSSLSVDFLTTIKNLYSEYGEEEAFAIGRNFLFDISHVIGMEDAKNFHKKMNVTDPIAKLSAGPVHFAFAGWAFVDISPESNPQPNADYFLKYDHPFSFEADSWIKAGQKSKNPVCIMNAGYSSGWCEQSFGMPLTAVELTCKASGDEHCSFIMAPPDRIEEHLGRHAKELKMNQTRFQIPSFFERKRVEEEMRAARKKAEESDQLKSEFLANMSHEIRTPMNGIIGMTELVLESELTETQREYMLAAHDSAEALLVIINQVLDFSKIEAEGITLDRRPFSLRSTVEEIIKLFALPGKKKGITISSTIDADVPDRLIGDDMRLRQILVNLMGNAVKFTREGSVSLTVDLKEQDLGGAVGPNSTTTSNGSRVRLHFQIIDSGIGIPQDKLESIFQAFTQVDMSTTRRYGGTGLGLTISNELARLMNGKIWCVNNPDVGSTFHFLAEFEVERSSGSSKASEEAPETEMRAEAIASHSDRIPTEAQKLNILVAEDGLINQKLVIAVLKKWGHSATIAKDGREAIQLWKNSESNFDLILMDVLMPNLNGLDATREIRKLEAGTEQRIPIIALTAQAMKGDRDQCLYAGMDDYISKPIRKEELEAAIHRLVQ